MKISSNLKGFGIFGTLMKLIRDAKTRIKHGFYFGNGEKSSPLPSPKERETRYEGFWWGLLVEFWGLLRVGGSSVNMEL